MVLHDTSCLPATIQFVTSLAMQYFILCCRFSTRNLTSHQVARSVNRNKNNVNVKGYVMGAIPQYNTNVTKTNYIFFLPNLSLSLCVSLSLSLSHTHHLPHYYFTPPKRAKVKVRRKRSKVKEPK